MSQQPPPPVDQSELATTLVARREGAPPGDDLMTLIRKQASAIERALPRVGITPERFTRLVATEIRRSPKLATCDQMSVLGAMMYGAQLGLEPGPLGQWYPVPFYNRTKRMMECQFILGYKGIIALSWRSQHLASIEARPVRDGDEFIAEHGLDEKLKHVKAPDDQRGAATHYYAIARYVGGGRYWESMSLTDVEKRRARSASKDASFSPWNSDYDAMACKSVIRAMAPYMPLSAALAEAIESDERVRVFDPDSDGSTRLDDVLPPPDETEIPDADLVEGVPCAAECGAPILPDSDDQLVEVDGQSYHASCAPRG